MKVTMLLADSAQAVQGKLYILGGGWSITGPAPSPSAIALKIEVPWDDTNRKHHLRIELVDADGKQVTVQQVTPQGTGEAPVQIEVDFEVGRPSGVKPGTPIPFIAAFNIPPLPLQPDGEYVWRLSIDSTHQEEWRAAFITRPPQANQPHFG